MGRIKLASVVIILSLIKLHGASSAAAQGLDGTLRGQARDSSGALVPGVLMSAKNEGTGAVRTVQTSSAGSYEFTNLLVGSYTVTAELQGFKRYVRPAVQVNANQVVEVNPILELGEVTTTIEVEGGADLLQTTTSQLAESVTGRALTELPNFGLQGDSSPYALAILSPGVTTQGGGILGEGGAIGGNRPRNNNFTVDGVDNNQLSVTGHALPIIADGVQEFNILTNQFSAEYGHSTAGQFNIISKSGSNEVHGDAFFTGNNRKLNAFDNLESHSFRKGSFPTSAAMTSLVWEARWEARLSRTSCLSLELISIRPWGKGRRDLQQSRLPQLA